MTAGFFEPDIHRIADLVAEWLQPGNPPTDPHVGSGARLLRNRTPHFHTRMPTLDLLQVTLHLHDLGET